MRIIQNTPDLIVLRHRSWLMGGSFLVFGGLVTVISVGAMLQGSDDSWPGAIVGPFFLVLGAVLVLAISEVRGDRAAATFTITTGLPFFTRSVAHPLNEVGQITLRTTRQSGKGGRYKVHRPSLYLASGMDKGDHPFGTSIKNKRKVAVLVETLNDWLAAWRAQSPPA